MEHAILGVVGILIVVGVAAFASRLGVAAPLILVVVGIVCSFIPGVPEIDFISPEIILAFVLPPILYSNAVTVPLVDFRRNLKAITGLSVLLVIISALASGAFLYWLLPDLSLPAAIALGAVISPPDAVAATAIGKKLGLPPRLVTLLEGEGLVNDASALVLLRSAVALTAATAEFKPWEVAGDFVYAVAAAIAIGLVVGYVTVWARSRLNDAVLTTNISFAVPFVAFIPAEEINASGVLAVVVAGLYTGHRSATMFSAQDRISERTNWRTAQFVLENGVFLLMGVELKTLVQQVQMAHLGVWHAIWVGLVTTLLLVVVRGMFIVPLIAVLRKDQRRAAQVGPYLDSALERLDLMDAGTERATERSTRVRRFISRKRADADFLTSEGLSWRGGVVLAWSGMRGVVTLAAAQSLPQDLPYRAELVLVAFTVAIVTLLGQGLTLPVVIRWLGVVGSDRSVDRAELAGLYQEMATIGLATLDNPGLRRDNGEPFDADVVERVREDSLMMGEAVAERSGDDEHRPHEQRRELRLRVLQAERAAFLDARATGTYSSRILERAQRMLDLEESRLMQLDGEHGHH
ncbi:sodium/proton antiporter, CPA1 family [Sanguibacter gelidistatuariae]|uniref:Sodium/proton antiporter, CPA1 family n=1 Tax=Sanguibacter gelidistatuariae TaxID=1814289 RepID=A0A1G6UKU1_9MICO|nr:sodium:proton antiporter [Sanguibacter gelidistatuariae]SDD42040.1 sodium/proton antiporter, CPA1 family [Sanguibacter gelidistatuariae]